jgi:hypothetical protein
LRTAPPLGVAGWGARAALDPPPAAPPTS